MAAIPRKKDVLLGKGTAINNHAGNKHLRSVVESQQETFEMSTKRGQKKAIAIAIVDGIKEVGGRFLVEDPMVFRSAAQERDLCEGNSDSGSGSNGFVTDPNILRKVWVFVGRDKAIEKVLHRLREKGVNGAFDEHKTEQQSILDNELLGNVPREELLVNGSLKLDGNQSDTTKDTSGSSVTTKDTNGSPFDSTEVASHQYGSCCTLSASTSPDFTYCEGYTFASFTPKHAFDEALPVLLFQSGHGSSVKCHEFLLNRIANEGYVVIVPQHPNDTGSNDFDAPPNKEAAGAVFEGRTIAELQTDGTHLAAAYTWLQNQTDGVVKGQKVDLTKVITGGFSAGCVEAINHAANSAPGSISGLVCIAPSTAEFVEVPYKFKRSDIKKKVADLRFPSLWITSESDLCNIEALEMFKESNSGGTTLVTFNDDILDLSLKLTDEFSIWGSVMARQNPGLAAHMAMACEKEVVADKPIVSFMKRKFDAVSQLEEEESYFYDASMGTVLIKPMDTVNVSSSLMPSAKERKMV